MGAVEGFTELRDMDGAVPLWVVTGISVVLWGYDPWRGGVHVLLRVGADGTVSWRNKGVLKVWSSSERNRIPLLEKL